MNAKSFLQQAHRTEQRVNSRLRRLSMLHSLATQVTSWLGGESVSGSGNPQRMEDTIAKIVDLERSINGEIDRLVDQKRAVMDTIEQVGNPDQQLILEYRYLDYKSWPEIAEELGFSPRWVQELHERALASIEKIIENQT